MIWCNNNSFIEIKNLRWSWPLSGSQADGVKRGEMRSDEVSMSPCRDAMRWCRVKLPGCIWRSLKNFWHQFIVLTVLVTYSVTVLSAELGWIVALVIILIFAYTSILHCHDGCSCCITCVFMQYLFYFCNVCAIIVDSATFTTHECAVVTFSVPSVFMSVCLPIMLHLLKARRRKIIFGLQELL